MKEVEAIVLAGGSGARMGEHTLDKQKCLLPIEDKPILGRIIDGLVVAFGSVDLKIAIGYKAEDVVDFVDRNKPKNVKVTYVPHEPGTEGWGIYREMRNYVRGEFVAMPGDILVLPQIYESVLLQYVDNQVEGAMTLSPTIHEAKTHGVGLIENERVVDLKWPPPSSVEKGWLRDMTIWASDTTFFDLIDRYQNPKKGIGHVFVDAIRDGVDIAGNYYGEPWIHLEKSTDLSRRLA